MRVRILSGNAKGQIVEMSRTEAEVNIDTGFAELVSDAEMPVVVVPVPEETTRARRSKAEPEE